ncbi:MAG: PaaI family thioesterase [Actinomycetota bacterium]|nr:PaaI family thioesterase [Actinomycetota bacterium]
MAPEEEDRDAALLRLAAATRDLVDTVVLTAADEDDLTRSAKEVEAVTERLRQRLLEHPPRPDLGPDGRMRALANPVIGEANPLAPPLLVESTPDGTARAEFELGAAYEGPPDLVHGGVSALILDHVLGSAGGAGGRPGMTGTLELRYRRPTPLHRPLVARAWIAEVDGRKTTIRGEIARADGRVCVEASGLFILPSFLAEQVEEAQRYRD